MLERNRAQVGYNQAPQKGRERSKNQKKIKNQKMEEKEKSLFDPGRHFPVPY
jgi:hypothetical protein